MSKVKPLQVRAVAPGWKIQKDDLAKAVVSLKQQGLQLKYSAGFCRGDFVFSQTAKFRAKDLIQALSQKSIDVVWSVRGGSGTQDLLPYLPQKRKSQDRHVVGLSDIAALHVFTNQFWGWQTLHAPVLARIGSGRATQKESAELFEILNGKRSQITFEKLRPINQAGQKARKTLRGKVLGGNLCVLEALIGTPFQPRTRGRIFFLEEVHERGYRIARSLTHMQQAGLFEDVKAVVWGDITGGDEADGRNQTWRAVSRFFEDLAVPAFRGIQTGHGAVQRPLPLNTQAKLERVENGAKPSFTLTVQTPQWKSARKSNTRPAPASKARKSK